MGLHSFEVESEQKNPGSGRRANWGVKAAGEGRLERQLERFYGIKETIGYVLSMMAPPPSLRG
jgi:hypothetical protein